MSRDQPKPGQEDRALRELFEEAHRNEDPPSFQQTWRAALRPRSPRRIWWGFASALGASAALLILWTARPTPRPPSGQEIQQVEWTAPLDFLLETPGSELLHTVPNFDAKGTLP
jgi:hypothetical protein